MSDNTIPFDPGMNPGAATGAVPLDRVHLGDFRVHQPSGAVITPHKGQSVWAYGYGLSAADIDAFQARMNNARESGNGLDELAAFVSSEVVKWDITNPRTGAPYPQPRYNDGTANIEAVKSLPNALLAFIVSRLVRSETEGEGDAGSGN